MGGGAALFDMDADGDLDLYLVQSGSVLDGGKKDPSNRLYRNRGDGTFEDATAGSGTDVGGYGMGVASGDYDNDGDPDLFVTNAGPNVLLRNDGQGRFTDATAGAGVAGKGWSTSAAFVDYDTDGDLDLFVLRYINWAVASELQCFSLMGTPDYCSPRNYDAPLSSVLYRNNGNGTFTDVSQAAGLHAAFGNGLGVVVSDVNRDGRPDLFVANDAMPNQLWINQGQGRFEDRALVMGTAVDEDGTAKSGMGVDAKDVDDDGDEDLLVVNLDGESDSFFRNDGTVFQRRDRGGGPSLGEPSVHPLRHGVDRLRQRRLARPVSSQRAGRPAGREVRRRPVRRAELVVQGVERRTIRGSAAARRHRVAADRLEPRGGVWRSSTTTAAWTSSWSTAITRRICCATWRRHEGTGWRFA